MRKLLSLLLVLSPLATHGQRSTLTTLSLADTNGTNFIIDMNVTAYVLTATNDVNFTWSTNRSATYAKVTTIFVFAGGTNRIFSAPTAWKWITGTTNNPSQTPPTTLSSNKSSVFVLRSRGADETNIIAHYLTQP